MRRAIWLVLIGTSCVMIAGCSALGGLMPERNVAKDGAIWTPAVSTVAATTWAGAPASPAGMQTPGPTGGAATSPAAAVATVAVTYTSNVLGISFQYLPQQEGQRIGVQESGDKVYVYPANLEPSAGQWVQVFSKGATESLEDAIRRQILAKYSEKDCPVVRSGDPVAGQQNPPTYAFARIEVPGWATDTMEALNERAKKCPQPYAAVGGLAYFVTDSRHPERLLFFSIGQYSIMAGPERPWQNTVTFLEPAAATSLTATPARAGSAAATAPRGPAAPTPLTRGVTSSPAPVPLATPTPPTRGAAPAATPQPGASTGAYIDDRSSAESVLRSYVNAINRREFVRAYAHWENPDNPVLGGPGPFAQFQAGFADTQSVILSTGTARSGAAAGNRYFSVPVTLSARNSGGTLQTYVGCYTLHLADPGLQAEPPYRSLAIQSAQVQPVTNESDVAGRMAQACDPDAGAPMPASGVEDPADISAGRYIDDRSSGIAVVRSMLNAINRREYARAYSYWHRTAGAADPGPFAEYQQGYEDTQSVQLTTGQTLADISDQQINYDVPVALQVEISRGEQTFVGCYRLQLETPGRQTQPPFRPLSVVSADLGIAPDGADLAELMNEACR